MTMNVINSCLKARARCLTNTACELSHRFYHLPFRLKMYGQATRSSPKMHSLNPIPHAYGIPSKDVSCNFHVGCKRSINRRKNKRYLDSEVQLTTSIAADMFLNDKSGIVPQNNSSVQTQKVDGKTDNYDELEGLYLEGNMSVDQIEIENQDDQTYNALLQSQNGLEGKKECVYELYSGPDASVPASDIPCPGCGAELHCQDIGIPGYMPASKFTSIPYKKLRENYCQRCALMKYHNIALNVSVQPEEYEDIIASIKNIRALLIVVVDIMDMPNSLYPNLKDLVGKHRPVYIVGNKVDLLPRDSRGYLERTKEYLRKSCISSGLTEDKYIRDVSLISAKSGYGVETLVTKLMTDWQRKGPVYIIGCTNVGKSTLFNSLLGSDYCKSSARDFINRATTCLWPGTTLNLLKFPIVDPAPWRLKRRAERLEQQSNEEKEMRAMNEKLLKETKKYKYASLMGIVRTSFMGMNSVRVQEDYLEDSPAMYTFEQSTGLLNEASHGPPELEYNEKQHVASRWCHDTPGVVNSAQIINYLTQKELAVLLTADLHVPRTFSLYPGHVIYVSGLGRIDYLEGNKHVYFTVISPSKIPIHIVSEKEVDLFYEENIGTSTLGIPLGNSERLNKIPSLAGKEIKLTGIGWKESVADISLSSLGWVAITTGLDHNITLRAFTPGGYGCVLRKPALLPTAVNLRGKRKRNSREYAIRPVRMQS